MNERGGTLLAGAVEQAYRQGQTDYFMEPLVRVDSEGAPMGLIRPGDGVVFCCRRGEREIEMTDMFTDPDFDAVERTFLPGLRFVPLTMYHEKFKDLPTAFAPSQVMDGLAEAVSRAGLAQLHCAESEKYAHVTFFFNGGHHQPFPGEDDLRIPSPKGIPFDQIPQLSIFEVVRQVRSRLDQYPFIVVNFANGDVIGHTTNREAKIAAATHVDKAMEELVEAARQAGFTVVVTADHGNLEVLYTPKGQPHVAHTTNKIPFVVVGDEEVCRAAAPLKDGRLGDVAPTILQLMGLSPTQAMEGQSLLAADPPRQGRVLLLILDGWGMGAEDETNPIHLADTPYWDRLLRAYPHSLLDASGEDVGLEAGKPGNSEAGHMNLGAGRVVPQDDQRLSNAISNGTFADNQVLRQTVDYAKKTGGDLHLLAYLTKKSSHGSIDYPLEICRMAGTQGLDRVWLHVIFDGRSTEPGSAPALLAELEEQLRKIGTGQIAGGVGRGLVLDRDKNYDRVKRAYDSMVLGQGTPYR